MKLLISACIALVSTYSFAQTTGTGGTGTGHPPVVVVTNPGQCATVCSVPGGGGSVSLPGGAGGSLGGQGAPMCTSFCNPQKGIEPPPKDDK